MDIQAQLNANWKSIDINIKQQQKWNLKQYVDVLAQKYNGLSDDQFDLTDDEKIILKKLYDNHMKVLKNIIEIHKKI